MPSSTRDKSGTPVSTNGVKFHIISQHEESNNNNSSVPISYTFSIILFLHPIFTKEFFVSSLALLYLVVTCGLGQEDMSTVRCLNNTDNLKV